MFKSSASLAALFLVALIANAQPASQGFAEPRDAKTGATSYPASSPTSAPASKPVATQPFTNENNRTIGAIGSFPMWSGLRTYHLDVHEARSWADVHILRGTKPVKPGDASNASVYVEGLNWDASVEHSKVELIGAFEVTRVEDNFAVVKPYGTVIVKPVDGSRPYVPTPTTAPGPTPRPTPTPIVKSKPYPFHR